MKGYTTRTCYLNFAEHLQNAWNVNFMYGNTEEAWGEAAWDAFLQEISAFGFTNFQFWIPPTLAKPSEERARCVDDIRMVLRLCHKNGLTANPMLAVNTFGAEWYFACPNDPTDKARIMELWTFYADNLPEADIFTVFPGDPGGCCRNGCTHKTYIALAAEIANMIKKKHPHMRVNVGTWGTPFTGWGEDMRPIKDWDGTFAMLIDPTLADPSVPCHIWNGTEERAVRAMEDFVSMLHLFPADTAFDINAGFNPDAEPIGGFEGLSWAKKVSETHAVHSWDYSASEGELICYPHYRVQKFKRKRMMEMSATQYTGSICYTMTPKLSQLTLYTAAHLMMDPDADAKAITAEFTELVFGDDKIGPLMEAFEIVNGWGYEKTPYTKAELLVMLAELIKRLRASRGKESKLPIFPSVDQYRDDLIWHAENFITMLGENPDREKIRKDYYDRALSVYKTIPKAVDERSVLSAQGYSKIGEDLA